MQSSKIDRIKDLVEQLNAASESYYAKDQEIMSNYEYDKLYDELVELEKETGVTLANSPTVNVGYEAVVICVSCWIRRISSLVWRRSLASRFERGSSKRRTRGSLTKALAMATRCC